MGNARVSAHNQRFWYFNTCAQSNQESSIKQHHWIILEKNIGIELGIVTSFIPEIWLSKMELFAFHHIWRWCYKKQNEIWNYKEEQHDYFNYRCLPHGKDGAGAKITWKIQLSVFIHRPFKNGTDP